MSMVWAKAWNLCIQLAELIIVGSWVCKNVRFVVGTVCGYVVGSLHYRSEFIC